MITSSCPPGHRCQTGFTGKGYRCVTSNETTGDAENKTGNLKFFVIAISQFTGFLQNSGANCVHIGPKPERISYLNENSYISTSSMCLHLIYKLLNMRAKASTKLGSDLN